MRVKNYSDWKIIENGREYASRGFMHEDYKVSLGAIDSIGYPMATDLYDLTTSGHYTSGGFEFASPVLQVAKDFAHHMGDSAFIKFLDKYEKYYEETYELSYKAEDLALYMFKDNERTNELEEKTRKEISEISSDETIGSSEKKKKLVAKRKELREIRIQSEKRKKSMLNKYVNLRKKVVSKQDGLHRRFNFDKLKKYKEIISFISYKIHDVLYQSKERVYNSSIPQYYGNSHSPDYPPLVINRTKELELFEQIKEEFYSKGTKKTL